MRIILYSRVSTDEQSRSGISLEAQRTKLRQWAGVFEHEVVADIVDAGESGKTLKRPGLQRALAMLKSGEADGLVICKLDRLTRSLKDWQWLIDNCFSEKSGKTLHSLTDSIDTSSPAGRLVLNVLLSVSQWEREAIAERTRVALQHKLATGKRAGEVRYGWDLAVDGDSLVRNEAEQAVIAQVLALRPLSYRKIADSLNAQGVPTKKGGLWSHTVVASICAKAAHEQQLIPKAQYA